MDTRYLRTLITAVETGSFSRAADQLHLTQSAVSQRVKFLEERFGRQLIDRSGSTLILTKAGEMVLASARQVLQIQDNLFRELDRLDEKLRLSVCCTPTFGTVYFPEVLNRFMRRTDNSVDIQFLFQSPEPALAGLRQNEFDLVVVEHCMDTDLKGFSSFKLPEDELLFVSAPSLQLPSPDLAIDQLLAQRLYARKDGCSSKKLVRSGLKAVGKVLEDFRSVVISDDLRLNCQSVMAGSGISFVSRSLVRDYLDSGQLVGHYVAGFSHRRCRSIVVHTGREDDPLINGFIESVYQTLDLPLPEGVAERFCGA